MTRAEVESALKKMKKNKATGPDEIPVKAWRVLGGEGADVLWILMIKIEEQEHIPDEWRESVLVPIYKEKGDVQECQNYLMIKLVFHTGAHTGQEGERRGGGGKGAVWVYSGTRNNKCNIYSKTDGGKV